MPIVTRGRKRATPRAVPVTASIWYGYYGADLAALPGVSNDDITALGIKDPSGAGAGVAVIFGCKSPFPAKFRKKLGEGTTEAPTQQASVLSYGDGLNGTQIKAAAAAGWRLISPVRTASFGPSAKSKNVAVALSNGLYSIHSIPTAEATEANATLFGWDLTLGATKAAKAFRGSKKMRPAKVTKIEGSFSRTYPCKWSKLGDAENAGWKKVHGEFISSDGPGVEEEPKT